MGYALLANHARFCGAASRWSFIRWHRLTSRAFSAVAQFRRQVSATSSMTAGGDSLGMPAQVLAQVLRFEHCSDIVFKAMHAARLLRGTEVGKSFRESQLPFRQWLKVVLQQRASFAHKVISAKHLAAALPCDALASLGEQVGQLAGVWQQGEPVGLDRLSP